MRVNVHIHVFDRLGQLIRQVNLAAGNAAKEWKIAELIRKKNVGGIYKQREQDRLQKEIEGAQEAVQRKPFGIWHPLFITTLNKNQTKNWLQQLKQEAKQVKQEMEQNLQQLRR